MATTSIDVARVREVARQMFEKLRLPGLAVGVVQGDDLVYAEAFGYADIESKRPMRPETRQRIGSITKTMAGLCAMALADEGKLSVDDLVADHLPDVVFHGPAPRLTLRHLMTHTSGIGEAPTQKDMRSPFEHLLWWDDDSPPPFAQCYPDGIELEREPGAEWAYANHGFALIGEIIERLEGAPLAEVMQRRIFGPLGMADSDCLDTPHPHLSTGYHHPLTADARRLAVRSGLDPEPDRPTVDGINTRMVQYQWIKNRATAAVQSTIPDMARYASALLRRGGGIVRPTTFDAMAAPVWQPDPRLTGWGLTFARQPWFGTLQLGHGGSVAGGWRTHIGVFPREGIGVLAHMNVVQDDLHEMATALGAAAIGAPPYVAPQLAVDASVLRSAPGVYEMPPGRLTNYRVLTGYGRLRIEARDGGLKLYSRRGPWKEGVRMLPDDAADPGFFALDDGAADPTRIALQRDASGHVTGLRFETYRMVKVEGTA